MVTNNSANNKTGASGTILQGQGVGVASDFSTATYPSTSGSSGNVIQSDGTNWNSVAGRTVGTWVRLDSQSASTSSTVALSGISATYNNYVIVFSNLVLSGSASCVVQLNSGSGFLSTGYFSGQNSIVYNSTTLTNTNTTTGLMIANGDNTTTMGGVVYLYSLTSGTGFPVSSGTNTKRVSGTSNMNLICGAYNSGITVTSIQIAMSTGTMTTGTFTLYGIVE